MTFYELQQRIPDATAETWHQHANGLGWVNNTAVVPESAFVSGSAIINDSASIGKLASIDDSAYIGKFSHIGDSAYIGKFSHIGDSASIGKSASIGDYTYIGKSASIGYSTIWSDSQTKIVIGCHIYTIERWLESFRTVGEREGYTDQQIEEYGAYIRLFALRYQPHLLEDRVVEMAKEEATND